MPSAQKLLRLAALCSFAIALVHVGALFGGESAARFFNAPRPVLTMIQQRSLWILPVVLGICGVLSTFGLYAWSGAGLMRRLPLLRTGLVTIGVIYFLRGLLIVPLLVFASRHPGSVSWQSFAFSIVSLLLGLAYLTGTFGRWRVLSHAGHPAVSNGSLDPAMADETPVRIARAPLMFFGTLSALGILACGLSYLVALPPITPAMLVSGSFESVGLGRGFGTLQTAAILLYAFALLPVAVALSIRQYRANPAGMIVAGCLTGLSVIMEIFNNLPALTTQFYPATLVPPPPEMQAYLQQISWIRYVSFDVAGFTFAFLAALLYAAIFRRKQPVLAWVAVGSVGIFLLHLPFLWISPTIAVGLMGLSICVAACTPLLYARLASE